MTRVASAGDALSVWTRTPARAPLPPTVVRAVTGAVGSGGSARGFTRRLRARRRSARPRLPTRRVRRTSGSTPPTRPAPPQRSDVRCRRCTVRRSGRNRTASGSDGGLLSPASRPPPYGILAPSSPVRLSALRRSRTSTGAPARVQGSSGRARRFEGCASLTSASRTGGTAGLSRRPRHKTRGSAVLFRSPLPLAYADCQDLPARALMSALSSP
jgi:hypothetical protein